METNIDVYTRRNYLSDLATTIATVRDKQDLWQLMIERIQPLLGFKASVSTIYSADYTRYCYMLFSGVLIKGLEQDLKSIFNIYLPIADTSDEWVMQQGDICSLSMLQKQNLANANPKAISILKSAGINYNLYIKLKAAGKVIGVQHYHFESAVAPDLKTIELAKSVTDMVAVAVANILANEEILAREKEKTLLLSLSEDMATIRNKGDLFNVIWQKIKPIVGFEDAVVSVYANNFEVYKHLVTASPAERRAHAMFDEIVDVFLPVKDSPDEFVLKEISEKNILRWDTEEIIKAYPQHFIGPFLKDNNLLFNIYQKISWAGNIIGFMNFHFRDEAAIREEKYPLYKSIADQVAVAVANILANDEIAASEKAKTLQIEIGKALAEEISWSDRMIRCARLFQTEIAYSLLLITIMLDDEKFITRGFYRTGRDEYQVLDEKSLQAILQLNEQQFNTHWLKLGQGITSPIVYSKEELAESMVKHPAKKLLMDHFKLRHHMIYPIYLNKFKMLALSFYNKLYAPYDQPQIDLLKSIQNYVGLCFDKVLAYDELEKANKRIKQENEYLHEEINNEHNFESIIGSSALLKEVFKNVAMVAAANTTVLISGETGTGKELIARSIHNSSQRNKKPFIKVNCAALPAHLIESELFGHERGSFTGAFEKRIGKFELADGGSIFLDEIGELPLELQAKLLRVLQEKEFERIGGNKTIKCDVRIIAATNRVLGQEVENGKFRADLYYRLNIFPIDLPPLRERAEDIPLLATYFAQKFFKKTNKPFRGIESSMLDALYRYRWPGNIRELENIIEQAVIVNQGDESLKLARALFSVYDGVYEKTKDAQLTHANGKKNNTTTKEDHEAREKNIIIAALQKTKGRIRGQKGAAVLLSIKPTTLESKMKKYEISKYLFGSLGG